MISYNGLSLDHALISHMSLRNYNGRWRESRNLWSLAWNDGGSCLSAAKMRVAGLITLMILHNNVMIHSSFCNSEIQLLLPQIIAVSLLYLYLFCLGGAASYLKCLMRFKY